MWLSTLEAQRDFLELGEENHPAVLFLTGDSGTGMTIPGWYGVTISNSLQRNAVEIEFKTDDSGSRPGFLANAGRVCCNPRPGSAIPDHYMRKTTRYTGVLLGTGDVVYHQIIPSSSGWMNIVLWSDTAGADVDLYVRCNALPTTSTYDFRAWSGDSSEFLSFSELYGCTQLGDTWYIAVHSWTGQAHFNLVASRMKSQHRYILRAGTDYVASPADLNYYRDELV